MTLEHVSSGDPHAAAHNDERDVINAQGELLENTIVKPSAPFIGQLLRFNGTDWTPSGTRLFEGTSQPEGVVAAPIGSRYVNTAGSQGAVEWLKKTGSGNTGWLLLAGDTGWRDISASINRRSTATVYVASLRRTGDVVDLYIDMKMPTNETSPYQLYTLPVGFRPSFNRHGLLHDNREGAADSTSVFADGTVDLYAPNQDVRDRWNGTWTTEDAWPTSLPGDEGFLLDVEP